MEKFTFFILIITMTTTTITITTASPYAFYGGASSLRALPAGSNSYSYGVHSSSLITPTQQQYHAQDDLGQYAYGYSEPLSSKQEVRSLDGTTRGSYSYRDAEGKVQTVDYTADASGFHVSATNLPRSPLPVVAEQPFHGASAPIATAITANAADIANAADTAIITASHRSQSASATAAALATAETAGLRLASAHPITIESAAVDSADTSVELPNTVDNTIGLAAGVAAVPAAIYHRSLMPSPLAYRTGAVLPKIYTYSYPPFSSRYYSGLYY